MENKESKKLLILLILILIASMIFFLINKVSSNKNVIEKDNKVVNNDNNKEKSEIPKERDDIPLERSIEDFPYSQIINLNISYEELNKAYSITNALMSIDANSKKIYNLEESPKSIKDLAKGFNFTDDEISNMNSEYYDLNNYNNLKIIDASLVKDEMLKLYGDYKNIFDSSFKVDSSILGVYNGMLPASTYYYDKNIEKVLEYANGGTGGVFKKVNILSSNVEDEIYTIRFTEAYFISSDDKVILKSMYEKETLAELNYDYQKIGNDTALLNQILDDYKDKLNIYEVSFRNIDGRYVYQNIKKI